MRSAALKIDFIPSWVMERLRVLTQPAESLHLRDRVGTYGSMKVMEVA